MSLTSPAAGQASASSIPSASSAATSAGDAFAPRHLGPAGDDLQAMLNAVNASSLDELSSATVPADIQLPQPLNLPAPLTEHQALAKLKAIASQNQVLRSMIGMGYHNTHTPPVIQRNIFENPLWYTPYTPYQAEIAQGRLEALLNFQTMLGDLTGLPVASASLLDEATAAAEAMAMCHGIARGKKPAFYIADNCHPQTIAICQTRAWSMGIDLRVGPADQADFSAGDLSGILLQYPSTCGCIEDYSAIAQQAHDAGALAVAAADILALTLLTPPGEWGADIAVGSTQRFGVPMGFGGPHAAYMTTTEKYVRKMPGRLVGVSKDEQGNPAYRLAIQTREQHIKRDKATSNICTAQVLLAILAGMYAVWHGPAGLRRIATQVHNRARSLAAGLKAAGVTVVGEAFFDTVAAQVADADAIVAAARKQGVNIRKLTDTIVTIACDETTSEADIASVLAAFNAAVSETAWAFEIQSSSFARQSDYLTHPVFHRYRSETEMMRYITRLQRKDISLAQSMIPLGSCTMKLNAAAEMYPVTWPEFGQLHPYAPADQTQGYAQMFEQLETWLAEITGFAGVSLQPNAGSQGEYAGLLAIRRYHESRGQGQRDVCLIPTSAHGTNPASAIIAGLRVVPVQCDDNGNINVDDLRAKAQEHKDQLSALMVTYPSTHGVFETAIREICKIVHDHGGQVYMDGANMNAQVGLCSPGNIGADVCHLNLHKTFCIPHGGGGPGMGPIGVAAHLVPFLPGCPLGDTTESRPVSAAAFGSPSILPIPWMYIAMMGEPGLKRATQIAILSANYMARKLADHYDVLYTGPGGRVAHEFIIDCRGFEKSADIKVEDIAKRLMDFGFHAPTMSFPVPGTLMIEPTESESREELDRFCDALIAIREEIRQIEAGTLDREDNPLKHAPHTAQAVTADDWAHAYKREQAAYPLAWVRENKFWPPVGRIDNAYGDRHLVCTCPPMSDFCES